MITGGGVGGDDGGAGGGDLGCGGHDNYLRVG